MKKAYQKNYIVKPQMPDEMRKKLAVYPDLLAHLLYHRGITEAKEADKFLYPEYDRDTHDPFLLAGMETAVERILKAIKNEEKTVIYSDYDTDGIPGGVTLHDFFKKVGFKNFTNYIPHRHDEGFGLNADAIDQFVKDKVKLLITIDCGIADVDLVARAQGIDRGTNQKKKMDVIVTDHHLPGEKLPPAHAIVNPKRLDCKYPEKMLCGSGVIYKVIQALIIRGNEQKVFEIKPGLEKWFLDMVGIATLSDMVPLTGENRVFAYYGLQVLRKSPRLGLVKLLSKLKVNQKHLVEDDIGFTIGPRINAASRMGVPMDAFRLLATQDETEADKAADHLNKINDERKGTVAALVKEVKHIIRERYADVFDGSAATAGNPRIHRVIVAGNPSWKPALLGLAANTCAEEYSCPVFLWGRDGDDMIKGSCRSDGVTNLVELMRGVPEGIFTQFGGHSQSGGFAVSNDGVHELEEKLNAVFAKVKAEQAARVEQFFVDAELLLDHVNWNTYRIIEELAPYGTGNPKPLFLFKNVAPSQIKSFGKEKNHLELIFGGGYGDDYGFSESSRKVSAIGFFMTPEDWEKELGRSLTPGGPINLVATFEKSMFRGRPELRLRIVDIL